MMTDWQPQSGWDQGRDSRWREKAAGLVLSVCFHGALVAIAVISVVFGPTKEEPEEEGYEVVFDDVELLALGEEVDPNALPRLTGDEGAPAAVEEVASEAVEPRIEPEPQPEEQAESALEEREEESAEEQAQREEERRRREAEERRRRMEEALGEFESSGRGDEAPEGSPLGVEGGTATDADQADMMQTYYARLLQEIERRWEVPLTLSDAQLEQLAGQVRVLVRLDDAGHITSYEVREKSDNEQFNASIERVLREFKADEGGQVLPLPEQVQIRQEIIDQGLMLSNWDTLDRG